MPTAHITPQYVNQPRDPSYRNGSVKDNNGVYWSVPKESLGMFQVGVTVPITYETYFKRDGTAGYKIVGVNGQAVGQGPVPAGVAAPQLPPQAAPAMPPPAAPVPSAAPAPPLDQRPAVSEHEKSRNMAIMGIIGRCLQGGHSLPTEHELTDMVARVKRAWDNGMQERTGNSDGPDAPLDDRIPF